MAIVITGADGFIGKNLRLRLSELGHADVTCMTRATATADMQQALVAAILYFTWPASTGRQTRRNLRQAMPG